MDICLLHVEYLLIVRWISYLLHGEYLVYCTVNILLLHGQYLLIARWISAYGTLNICVLNICCLLHGEYLLFIARWISEAPCVISWLSYDSRDVISTWWRQIWRRCGQYGSYGTIWYELSGVYCIAGPYLWCRTLIWRESVGRFAIFAICNCTWSRGLLPHFSERFYSGFLDFWSA